MNTGIKVCLKIWLLKRKSIKNDITTIANNIYANVLFFFSFFLYASLSCASDFTSGINNACCKPARKSANIVEMAEVKDGCANIKQVWKL